MTDPDAIAKRAYELFLERGAEPGREVDDWLQAEAEINAHAAAEWAEEQSAAAPGPEEEERGSVRDRGPAVDRDRAAGKRSNGSRRVARQQDTR